MVTFKVGDKVICKTDIQDYCPPIYYVIYTKIEKEKQRIRVKNERGIEMFGKFYSTDFILYRNKKRKPKIIW